MKRINISTKKYPNIYTLVDDNDFEWLNQWKWNYHHGYVERNKNNKTISMHRLINNTPNGFETDHINRNKLDNRRINLRTVTLSQNRRNIGIKKNNTSSVKGAVWLKKNKKWLVRITTNKKVINLGLYSTLQGAWLARRWGERAYWGHING